MVIPDAVECKNDSCVDKTLHEDVIAASLGSEFIYVHGNDLGENTCDVPQNVETSSCTSNFPKSAQTFVEAIKKNRSCQKFIRNKMLHIEAKMEANRALQKRLKTLRDFQVQCKKTIGRALSQKQDSRVQLISVPKQKPNTKVMYVTKEIFFISQPFYNIMNHTLYWLVMTYYLCYFYQETVVI